MFEKTMTPYQYAYQNPVKFIDPTGMQGENTNEPPIKGIAYFSDDTGQYFWNHNKDSYEHYATGQDGYSYYEGMYTVDESKGPAGDYTIHLEGRKPGELAVKDIVEELYYTDVSREDVGRTITLEYSSRNLISSEVFAREKNTIDTRQLISTRKEPKSLFNIISGVSIVANEYEETRAYGSSFNSSTSPTRNDAKTDMIKYGAEKLGEALKLGVKSLIKKR